MSQCMIWLNNEEMYLKWKVRSQNCDGISIFDISCNKDNKEFLYELTSRFNYIMFLNAMLLSELKHIKACRHRETCRQVSARSGSGASVLFFVVYKGILSPETGHLLLGIISGPSSRRFRRNRGDFHLAKKHNYMAVRTQISDNSVF